MIAELDVAVYNTVHDFEGGPKALANYLSVRPGTLSNKADPACDTHHLNINEALAIMLVSKDFRVLHALAFETNHAVIELTDLSGTSDMALLDAYTNMNRELGDVACAISEGLDDQRLTPAEYKRIHREMYEAFNAQIELLRRLEALIDGD